MIGLRVIRPGLCSTVQDGGRIGWRRFGVPWGGAWDRGSMALANLLVGNQAGDAVIELTLIGGEFEATGPIVIGLAGAVMPGRLESSGHVRLLVPPSSLAMAEGDRLILGAATAGARAYLSVLGGWRTPEVLGSRSSERRLAAGELVPALASDCRRTVHVRPDADRENGPIRYMEGIERSDIDWKSEYQIGSESNRMGLRLEGPLVAAESPVDRESTPVLPGTMQVAGGRLIVLGPSGGTMGGYPQVGQVISADWDRLGQVRPGDRIRFERTTMTEARRLDEESRRRRAQYLLRIAAGLKASR